MSDTTEKDDKEASRLQHPGRLELRKTVETGEVRQRFSHGRSKAVTVEVRRKRTFAAGEGGRMTEVKPARPMEDEASTTFAPPPEADVEPGEEDAADDAAVRRPAVLKALTADEKETRARALETARRVDQETRKLEASAVEKRAEEEQRAAAERDAAAHAAEEEARQMAEEEAARAGAEEEARAAAAAVPRDGEEAGGEAAAKAAPAAPAADRKRLELEGDGESGGEPRRRGRGEPRRPRLASRHAQTRRRAGKLTISQALVEEDRMRSLASVRRAREREREKRAQQPKQPSEPVKVVREVIVPESITIQELANRMAVRGVDVVKATMKIGETATINQTIDADTAELLVHEFGHQAKRVSAADVELGLKGEDDTETALQPRPPVVTVMGHVDHGKTSLLDALRGTDVVRGEAGGITQHIGAYQVTLDSGARITFIDTPGHEAFTAMRSRGAKVTDIVVLVVAADDGVMPQTVEAINHAKAAEVPIVVAVNKIDKPEADPGRVRNELLQHGIVMEELGGDVLSVDVSATEKRNLDKLGEAVVLQAELLDLKANAGRPAEGVVIEAKIERGRGAVATVLVQRGTLRVGDIVVAGSEWARVRALIDDRGRNVEEALPGFPVEVVGLSGVPAAGDEVLAVPDERRAREVTEYRQELLRETRATTGARGDLEAMFAEIEAGRASELPLVIKADVHGSVEAIRSSLENLGTDEVMVKALHTGVGGISESDVALAQASNALIIGFNVRANPQARDLARRDGVEIRYYSVIYNVVDDIRAALSGMLAPSLRERLVGNAQVLEVFDISKLGKIAGCRVTDGVIKRGAKVRLLRDDMVIYEGRLGTLKRFKDDVREVKDNLECGMSFDNYHDIRVGDVIEAIEIEEVARTL